MTELETMQRAKMYLDKLANGINPLTDQPTPDSDCINQVRISRCLFYVSDVLRKVIENGGNIGKSEKIKAVSEHALDTLQLRNGAAHIELKIDGDKIRIIEIGGRMGGDFIGSDLVELSTGYDFVKAVIEVALGIQPAIPDIKERQYAGVNFIMNQSDVEAYEQFKKDHPGTILKEHIDSDLSDMVTDSSNRHGYYIFRF